jgi:hypothetical protein
MNIRFSYLYRDSANYRQYNEVIFVNSSQITVKEIEAAIKEKLIDRQWFIAKDWGLPDIHFKEFAWDSEIDHDWHEFEGIEETLEEATNNRSLEGFLLLVSKTKLPW